MTDRAKMEAARDLIHDKDYRAARAILKTVDAPLARQWLEKIAILEGIKQKRNSNRAGLIIAIALLLVLLLSFGSVAMTKLTNGASTNIANIEGTALYCTAYCNAVDSGSLCVDRCYGTKTP